MDNNNEEENALYQQQMAILKQEEDEYGISVPNWLVEVLAWITRMEMVNSSLSYSCKLFKLLCWPKLHENVKPHKIDNLEYRQQWYANAGYLQLNPRCQRLPMPKVPPPSYILGFDRIVIRFLDDQFVEFAQHIFPRLNKIVFYVNVGSNGWMEDEKKINAFRSLLNLLANKIVKFAIVSASIFEFNQLFPGFFKKVHFLRLRKISQSPTQAEFSIFLDWLTMPPPTNADIKQKILKFGKQLDVNETNQFIERIKEEFSCARSLRNFFIIFPRGFQIAHFNMENEKTGEILTVTEKMQILRCPKGEENRWIEEGQNKTNPEWIGHPGKTHIDYSVRL